MAEVKRDRLMEVPSEALFRVITDFENYPKFLPEVVSAKAGPVKNGAVKVTFAIEVMKSFEYELEFRIEGKERIAWDLVKSNFFKTNRGVWELKPQGQKTQVHYELEVAFGFLVPGWITKKLTEVNLPKMFDSFEERARSLEGGK